MRKTTKLFNILLILTIVVATITSICLTGCNPGKKDAENMYSKYTDLAEDAKFIDGDKTKSSFKIKGKENEKKGITVDLGASKQFNTIELSESTKGVTMFSIFASDSPNLDTFNLIYEGDTIEDFRICFVGDVKYRYLRIDVVDSSKDYNVKRIKIYNNINKGTQKRVASYFLIDRVLDTDLNALDAVSDIVMFSWMRFDKDGNIKLYVDKSYKQYLVDKFTEQGIDGEAYVRDVVGVPYDKDTVDTNKDEPFLPQDEAEKIFAHNLKIFKTSVRSIEDKQNRKINVFPTILMPWSDDPNDANKYARAIMKNPNKTAKNVKAFIDKYGFDGVDFDYEYPYSNEEHKLFDSFLIAVDKAIGKDKILSTAIGAWNVKMSKEAIAVVDQFQLMTYDMFDSHGYHAAFSSSVVLEMGKAIDKKIPVEKINLGLPFYSRPICRAGYWGDYFKFFEDGEFKVLNSQNPTSKYKNLVSFATRDSANYPINEPEYFNGYQMIQDKTAFAIDTTVGGVMIWHMSCDIKYDNDLSLFRAISETFKAKDTTLKANK